MSTVRLNDRDVPGSEAVILTDSSTTVIVNLSDLLAGGVATAVTICLEAAERDGGVFRVEEADDELFGWNRLSLTW